MMLSRKNIPTIHRFVNFLFLCLLCTSVVESLFSANRWDMESTTFWWNNIPQEKKKTRNGPAVRFRVGVGCNAPYSTIGQAMVDARSGDILELCEGVFQESVSIFNMELTIRGQGPGKTVLKAPFNTRYLVNAGPNSNVTIHRLTLDGHNNMAQYVPTPDNSAVFIAGVLCFECAAKIHTVDMIHINSHNADKNPTPSYGVFARSMNKKKKMLEVTNCNITETSAGGVMVDGKGMLGLIRRNNVKGAGKTFFPSNGIQVSRQASAVVKKNNVSDYQSVAPHLFLRSGISTVCSGPETQVRKNNLHDNDVGITLVSSMKVQVRNNQLTRHIAGVSLEVRDVSGDTCPKPHFCSRNKIFRNTILESSENGIQFLNKVGKPMAVVGRNKVDRNVIKYSDKFHIAMMDGKYDLLRNNKLQKAGNTSVYIAGGTLGLFQNNVVVESFSCGVWVQNEDSKHIPANFTFTKNLITLSGEYGVFLQGGDSFLFDSNDIQMSGIEGIKEESGANHRFVDNQVS